ncbi:MAG: phage minor head protein, partial [bacterium]
FIKSTTKHEKYMLAVLKVLFNEQKKEVLNNLGVKKELITKDNLPATWSFNKKKWEKLFQEESDVFYKGIVVDYGKRSLSGLDIAGLSFDVANPRVEKFIERNGVLFGRETQSTAYEALKKQFIEGLKEGEGIPQLADRVSSVYAGYVGDNPWKAIRIARTEIIKSSNFGSLEGYKQSGVVKNKQWISTRDNRTRDDHRVVDGQSVALDSPFIVGGEELMHPGDPSGSAEQNINCRCAFKALIV